MKRLHFYLSVFLLLLIMVFAAGDVKAQDRGFGLGVMLGSPTGISGKYWTDNDNAIDFGVGFRLGRHSGFNLHADYLYHISDALQTTERIPFYYGFGLKIFSKSDNENGMGVRGVAGLVWLPKEGPFDIFFEIAPVFELFPDTQLGLDASLGARYYFY